MDLSVGFFRPRQDRRGTALGYRSGPAAACIPFAVIAFEDNQNYVAVDDPIYAVRPPATPEDEPSGSDPGRTATALQAIG